MTREDELAARVEALETGLSAIIAHVNKVGTGSGHWWYMNYAQALLISTPESYIAHHDQQVLREAFERVDRCCTAQATRASYEHIRSPIRAAILNTAPENEGLV
jgi:hypothetical protein